MLAHLASAPIHIKQGSSEQAALGTKVSNNTMAKQQIKVAN
jgi:hypothetical protein